MFSSRVSLLSLLIASSILFSGCAVHYKNDSVTTKADDISLINHYDEALALLKKRNANYLLTNSDAELRKNLAANGQHPYAIVITCSDSRDVPEIVFGSSFGELFTIRSAGNVIGDFELGSVEYGVEHLHTKLVVVMGHTNCGAVTAACESLGKLNDVKYVNAIVNQIIPQVNEAAKNNSEEEVLNSAIELNVYNSIKLLRESEYLANLEKEGKIKIVGAIYDIVSGQVKFLE